MMDVVVANHAGRAAEMEELARSGAGAWRQTPSPKHFTTAANKQHPKEFGV